MIYTIAQSLVHGISPTRKATKSSPRDPFRTPRKGLVLALGERPLYFHNLDDFSFAIEAKTAIPNQRFHELLDEPGAGLLREAEGIKSVEKQLVRILEQTMQSRLPCGPEIKALGLQVFSKDHGWRSIIEALNDLGPEHDAYKRTALIKYLQYLGARQEMVRMIVAGKCRAGEPAGMQRQPSAATVGTKETVIFDLSDSGPFDKTFQRLPSGETIRLRVRTGTPVELLFANHTFGLLSHDGWFLLDPHGGSTPLKFGPNTIGRGRSNDIPLLSDYANVSRRHLIAEPTDARSILLTDLSSHGTFVPPTFVDPVIVQ